MTENLDGLVCLMVDSTLTRHLKRRRNSLLFMTIGLLLTVVFAPVAIGILLWWAWTPKVATWKLTCSAHMLTLQLIHQNSPKLPTEIPFSEISDISWSTLPSSDQDIWISTHQGDLYTLCVATHHPEDIDDVAKRLKQAWLSHTEGVASSPDQACQQRHALRKLLRVGDPKRDDEGVD